MKKLLCLILCMCLIGTVLPMGVFAAETETVLFEEDFEDYAPGEDIRAKAETFGEWSQAVASAVSTIQAAEYDAAHGMSAYYSHNGTTSGGPRLHKWFYFEQNPTNITLSYDAKGAGAAVSSALYFADGTHKSFYSAGNLSGEHVEIAIDFTKGAFVVYSNGSVVKTGSFSAPDYTSVEFRFNVGVAPGKSAYLDNVKFTTTDVVDPIKASDGSIGIRTPEEIMAPFAQVPAAPELGVPADKVKLFTYDGSLNANNGINTGSEALWTKVAKTMSAILNGNNIVRLTNDKRCVQYGSLTKKVAVGNNPGKLYMEYYTVLSGSGVYVALLSGNGNTTIVNTSKQCIAKSTPGAIADGWNKITAEFDLENSVCRLFVNGIAAGEIAFTAALPADNYEVMLSVGATLAPADSVLLDNFVMYQDNAAVVEGVKYYGVTGTNWDMVTRDIVVTGNSYVSNLRQHPRLYINDKQALLDKIATEPQVKKWYDTCKSNADKFYDQPLLVYGYEGSRNASGVLHEVADRLMAWGIAYMVEGDEKYVLRGLEEIRNAGNFPDWSNSSPILPSGIMIGFACFYDWCYDSATFTPEVKAEIVQVVKDKALWQFVRSYDGVITVEIANGTSNRTTVANTVSAAMAIAMADEEPQLAQKLMDGAVKSVKQAVLAYSPDGAFAEGTSYWNYANTHMYDFLIEMQGAVVDTYVLPEDIQWYYESEQLLNTPKYWAYMHGPAGNFDYGDSSPGFSKAEQIFWISQTRNQPFYSWYLMRTMQRNKADFTTEQAVFYFDPGFVYYNDGTMPLDKTFNASDLAQVASMRSSWTAENALYAAIQGGDNKTGHMAKSLGTFVLDANGKRFVKQIGHVDYSALYDADLYYMERAEGNNTILANPGEDIDQIPSAVARFVAHGEAENQAFTVLDMTETNDAFTDAKRGMFMTRGRNSIILQDEIQTNTPSEIWWFAHTDAELTLIDGGKGAIMDVSGEKMVARITSGPADAVFTVMDAKPLPTSPIAPDEVYVDSKKLAIHMQNVSDITLAVEFVPLRKGEGIPTSFTAVKPIANWSVSDNTIPAKRQAGDALVMLKGSPSVLAYEEKFAWNTKDSAVKPFAEDGVLYVPAARACDLVYAKTALTENSISITRNAVTTTITEGVVTKNGVLYVPATALAEALGMHLRTEENGLYVFADKLPVYTEAAKQAIYNELNTNVFVNGRHFEAFSTEKTVYYIPFDEVMPPVRVSSGEKVTKTAQQASFVLNGTTYTFHRVDVNDVVSKYNTVLGKIVSSDKPMGTSYIPAQMTDGNMSTSAAVKSTNEQNVTFTFELDNPHRMKEFILTDMRDAAGSVMERVVYSVRLEDGTWVEAGMIENLDAAETKSKRRTNETICSVDAPVTAVRFYMENTDDYLNRLHIYEFEAIGVEIVEAVFTPATKTTYELQGDAYAFTTEITASPESGYLVCALYQGAKQVGMKIVPVTGQETVNYSLPKTGFDSVKVMLIESFINMRILAEPEIL